MTIEVSPKVMKMLNNLPRKLGKQPMTREEIEAKLAKAKCPVNHPIVDFQLQFGGYCYDLHSDIMELGMGRKPTIRNEDGHWLCEFIDSKTSQIRLYMGEDGVLYTETITEPFASSIKIFLEYEATLYFFPKQWVEYNKSSVSPILIQKVTNYLKTKSNLRRVSEASDKYMSWWLSEDYAVSISSLPYDLTIFAISDKKLEEVKKSLMNIIESK